MIARSSPRYPIFAVPVLEEMLGSRPGAAVVVAANQVYRALGFDIEIEQHDRRTTGYLGSEQIVSQPGRYNDQPVHTPVDQPLHEQAFSVGGTVGAPSEHQAVAGPGYLFDTTQS